MSRIDVKNALRTLRRPVEEHRPLTVGIVTVAAIVVSLAVVLGVSRSGAGEVTYRADFAQAAGIAPGDSVSVAGVQVGSVDSTELAGDHVVVGFRVDRDVPLGSSTRASIKLTTLLGSRYLELRPAGDGELTDRRIPLDHTDVPYDLQQVLGDATTTFEQVDAAKIGQAMNTLSDQLAGTPALVPQVLTNIGNLSSILADRRDQIGSLLRNTADLTDAVRAQQGQLGQLVTDGTGLVQDVVLRQATLERLLSATTTLIDRLDSTVVGRQQEIDALVADLQGLLQTLTDNDALLRNILEILPVPLRNFTNATGTANEVDFTAPAGPLIDSWMCAISGRANEINLPPYLEDCR
ncbi:MCE family protein [Rhodococcus sp. NPDC003348]